MYYPFYPYYPIYPQYGQGRCPCCGACLHCGNPHPFYPIQPQPYYGNVGISNSNDINLQSYTVASQIATGGTIQ